ncbi:MAG: prolyl oligopeptidase family serine peptidase [Planctomycetia bacterium]|nr:prolyl oligopeptidase family serine peptidase [Planctomycetia bacterium]
MRTYKLALFALLVLVGGSLKAADEPDPRRPAAIATEGVPVVPPSLFARLAQYQSVRGAAFRGWSPDGDGILINTRFGNSSQLHRVYEPGGRREQITFFDEPCTGGFIPKAKDGAILLSMDQGGTENSQLLLLDRTAYQTTLLTDGKSRNGGGPFSFDGARVVVSSNARNGRDFDLYIADPRRPGSMSMVMEVKNQTWHAMDWSQDGETLLLRRYVSANESYAALLDVSSGERTDLPLPGGDSGAKAAIDGLAFTPDAQAVYVVTDTGSEFLRLARLDLATKKYGWLTENIPWDVDSVVVEPTSGDVAFTINEDGRSKLFLLRGGDGERRELSIPLAIASGLEFSPDGKRLGVTLARPDAPPDAYSIDLAGGELTRWTYSEVGGLDPESFVLPKRIGFESFDGRTIPAYYYKPRRATAEKKVPVVISIHGGPEGQYRPTFSPVTQFYANELGLAVIHPNVRGSAGYGKTYLQLDNAEKRLDSVRDIGALLDWIREQPELDASRVAVTGGSYGGFMVLASLVHHGDRIKAGVDVVGIANFLTFLEKTAAYRVDLRRAEYGDERDPAMRKAFEEISPLNHADMIRSALLVVHGRNDPRVPFFEAQQIAAKVRKNGRSVWTVYADNEGHGFSKKDNADYSRAVEVLFLAKHLGLNLE